MLVLGDASYSIYLTHSFLMTLYAKVLTLHVLPGLPVYFWVPIPILVSLLVGLTTYRFIERPLNDRLKVWWNRVQVH